MPAKLGSKIVGINAHNKNNHTMHAPLDHKISKKAEFAGLCYSIRSELLGYLKRKIGHNQDAEDCLQELFFIIEKFDETKIGAIDSPRCYVFRIAHNLAISLLKNRLNRNESDRNLDVNDIACSASAPDVIVEARQRAELLKGAIASMPHKRRDIFLHYRFGKMTQPQIAAEFGISTKGVEKHIARALEHCHTWLAERGFSK